jgi:uncharacterized protein (DUF885 family)
MHSARQVYRILSGPLQWFAVLCGLLFCSVAARADSSVSGGADRVLAAQFHAFLESTYREDMALQPSTASARGWSEWQDRWDSESPEFFDQQRAVYLQRQQALAEFEHARLSESDRLSYELYQQVLQRALASDDFREHQYVLTHHRGIHTAMPSFLIGVHRIRSLSDAESYVARLQAVGTLFDEHIAQLELRAQRGFLLPAWSYPKILQGAGQVIRGLPFDESEPVSSLWADFSGKLAVLQLAPEQAEAMLQLARTALLNEVKPAYLRLMKTLSDHAQRADNADGVWRFDDGEAFYAERLQWFTTTQLSAAEIHAIGIREVARIHADMQAIMRRLGFSGDLQAFFDYMRNDPAFYFSNDEAGREAYLASVEVALGAMRGRLHEVFGMLPQSDLIVRRVELFRERSAGKAFYLGPPADGSRPGTYYANLYDMADMPKYQLEALAFHEGVPGHHMQRGLTVSLQDIPTFQKYARFTAFTEGWAMYAEQLAKDMGFYSDPYSDFGRLAMELWRAARLVVDTGIHAQRWSRQQAVDYLLANTPNPPGDAAKAIDRYIAQPGQATAYMIGKLAFMRLRQGASARLAEQFDLRAFHDELLRYGPMPLNLLEQRMQRWIDQQSMLLSGTTQ